MSTPRDWSKLTVAQLKEECTERGLETAGKKADLISRLEEHVAANEEEMETAEGNGEAQEGEGDSTAQDAAEDQGEEETEDGAEKTMEVEEEEKADEGKDAEKDGDEELLSDVSKLCEDAEKKEETTEKTGEGEEGDAEAEGDGDEEEGEGEEKKDKPKQFKLPDRIDMRDDRRKCLVERAVYVGPLTIDELINEDLVALTKQARSSQTQFTRWVDNIQRGVMQLVFCTRKDAEEAAEKLKTLKEGIFVKYDPENYTNLDHFDRKVRQDSNVVLQEIGQRLIIVHSLPEETTDQDLLNIFTDAFNVLVPRNQEGKGKGYAWVEYTSSEAATEALGKYEDAELNEKKLSIVKFRGTIDEETKDLNNELTRLNEMLSKLNLKKNFSPKLKNNQRRRLEQRIVMLQEQAARVNRQLGEIRKIQKRENIGKDNEEKDEDKKNTPKFKKQRGQRGRPGQRGGQMRGGNRGGMGMRSPVGRSPVPSLVSPGGRRQQFMGNQGFQSPMGQYGGFRGGMGGGGGGFRQQGGMGGGGGYRGNEQYAGPGGPGQAMGPGGGREPNTAKAVNLLVGLSQMLSHQLKTGDPQSGRGGMDYDGYGGGAGQMGNMGGQNRDGGGYYDRQDDQYWRKRPAQDDMSEYRDYGFKQSRMSGGGNMGGGGQGFGGQVQGRFGNQGQGYNRQGQNPLGGGQRYGGQGYDNSSNYSGGYGSSNQNYGNQNFGGQNQGRRPFRGQGNKGKGGGGRGRGGRY